MSIDKVTWKKIFITIVITAIVTALFLLWLRPWYRRREVMMSAEDKNVSAFLKMIRWSENPNVPDDQRYYRTYGNTRIMDMSNHPVLTGEWMGKLLPEQYCRDAGLNPPCKSTAAGAYQAKLGTWMEVRDKLKLPDFTPKSQDLFAIQKIQDRGALMDVKNGNFSGAVEKLKNEWASLPGNSYNQAGVHQLAELQAEYQSYGGTIITTIA